MAVFTVDVIEAYPQFDLELFMSTCQETRIGGDIMNRLSDAWDTWVPSAQARKITAEGQSYLLVWLGEPVEEAVDTAWETTPSEAFMFNALAQVMCMGMVHNLLPEVEEAGCAAAPAMTPALEAALAEIGVTPLRPGEPGLERRYAVLTYHPFKGACEACHLRPQCPKGSGQTQGCSGEGVSSITLPGFDRIEHLKKPEN